MSNRIALFDFCDTLIKGQSVSLFLNYLLKKEPSLLKKIAIKLSQRFNPYNSSNSLNYKNHLLKPFQHLNKSQLETLGKSFFSDIIQKKIRQPVLKRLQEHQKNNLECIIISGGFGIYLNYFASHYKIKQILSTRLKFKNSQFLGKIDGEECLGANKVKQLKAILDLKNYDLENSYAYSDHLSDKPILELVGNSYVIDFGQNIEWKQDNWKIISVE